MTEPIKQPEALRLADLLEDECGVDGYVHDEAAAELHRLHAEVERLRFALTRIAGRCDTEAAYKIARAALKETK